MFFAIALPYSKVLVVKKGSNKSKLELIDIKRFNTSFHLVGLKFEYDWVKTRNLPKTKNHGKFEKRVD